MKQKLIFALITAALTSTAMASQQEEDSSSKMRDTNSIVQTKMAQNEAQVREHFIRVAELAGFEVLGSSNPDTVALNEMVLTVRPQAERLMWLSNHYNNKDLHRRSDGENGGDRRHDEDDD